MSDVRVTYSGLINFGVILISFITGLVFTIIVTRRLSPEEFGLWSLIGSLLLYVMIFKPINEYWTTRHVARNEDASVTAIISSGIFSAASIGIFLVVIFVVSANSDADYQILLFSVILIPLSFFTTIMMAITAGFKPQGSGYSLLVFEVTKIPLGFFLVYLADMGIFGAILTTAIASGAQIIFFTYYLRDKLKEKFHMDLFKKWLKLSWLPMFGSSFQWILNFDRTVFILFVGSVTSLAYVGVAIAISQMVSSTRAISSALYPKLISSQQEQYIELILKRSLLFAIPALGLTLVFAKPGLWILNPQYIDGVFIVYVWSISHFAQVFHTPLASALTGLERIDVGFKSNFKEYIKSKLFFVPLIYLISYSAYIVILIAVMIISSIVGLEELEIIFWWGVGGTISNIGIGIVFGLTVQRQIKFNFPLKQVLKYTTVTIIASIISFLLLNQFLIYEKSIFQFLPSLIPHLVLFVAMYLSIILLWDKDSREFFRLIIKELTN